MNRDATAEGWLAGRKQESLNHASIFYFFPGRRRYVRGLPENAGALFWRTFCTKKSGRALLGNFFF